MMLGTYQGIADHAIAPYIGALTSGDFKMVRDALFCTSCSSYAY